MRTALKLLTVLGGGGPYYPLRDSFVTAQSPATSPRTCEPGPGTLTLVSLATATISIAAGKLVMPRPTAGHGYDKYGFYASGDWPRARKVGRALYAIAQCPNIDRVKPICWNDTAEVDTAPCGAIFFNGTTSFLIGIKDAGSPTVGTSLTINTDYQMMIVQQSAGFAYFIRGGTQFPNWTLVYVCATNTSAELGPMSSVYNSGILYDELRIYDLPAPFTTDTGWATYSDATPTANDVATGTADAFMSFVWTPGAGETLSIYFRRTDDDNAYHLDCAQADGTIKLYRREAASDTELDAGKTQTWSAGTPYRICLMYHAGAIRTWVNNVDKHAVTGETYGLTVTGCKVAGFAAGANWRIYQREYAGTSDLDIALS